MIPLLLWGKDSTGKLVHIEHADNGLACNLQCPRCGEPLVAKQGEQIQWHFAHASGITCEGAFETVLHKLAKEIIFNARRIRIRGDEYFTYHEVKLEAATGDYRADALLTNTITGKPLIVEIFVSHLLTPSKIDAINRLGYTVLEIDLSGEDLNIDQAELKDLILEQTDSKELHEHELIQQAVDSPSKFDWGIFFVVLVLIAGILWLLFHPRRPGRYRSWA